MCIRDRLHLLLSLGCRSKDYCTKSSFCCCTECEDNHSKQAPSKLLQDKELFGWFQEFWEVEVRLKGHRSLQKEEKNLLAPIAMEVLRKKQKMNPPLGISEGTEVKSLAQFDQAKSSPSSSKTGKRLDKNFLYTTRNAYDYKLAQEKMKQGFKYKPQIFGVSENAPEWFRVLDKPSNKNRPENSPACNGTLTYISRSQGWITVDANTKNRCDNLEKMRPFNKIRQTSILMPEWMHIKAPAVQNNPTVENYFHPEKQTPVRSIFSSGYFTQKVHSKEMAKQIDARNNLKDTYRPYQWIEDTSHQRYDQVPVASKIGSLY
eukprot:TRINITY_DN2891_c0_g1_i1.p1 TRINITY_DN2891_c0_g1~~TRINITY_DN2891_c0_g1_i1.p1  ORF type:complete len:318 (+),score=50.08 TRINITY_DN2891_c0_g1_i1:77-1030(+)